MGRSPIDPSPFTVSRDSTIADVIRCINSNSEGIALLVDAEGKLVDTITDGDVRRCFLSGARLDDAATRLIAEGKAGVAGPIVATRDMTDVELLNLMGQQGVKQVPVLDQGGRVVDMVFMHQLAEQPDETPQAIVMAGGKGSRLLPLTETLPKPLLPIGDKPVMERTIDQLRVAGIHRVNIAVHHMSEQIANHFGDGSQFGVDLNYVREDRPLGTAGSIRRLAQSSEPLLVINADIVTTVSYRAFLEYHKEHGADVTIAARVYEIAVPFGVLRCEGTLVTELEEKPVRTFLVNAGIYLVEPRAVRHIPEGEPYDMTDLVTKVLEVGGSVSAFPIHEYWLDIGQHQDYLSAKDAFEKGHLD